MSGRWLAALLALALALAGCVNRVSSEKPAPPFVFRALNLSHRNSDGSLAWELKSPEARYDLERRLAQAVDLRGLIYQKGKPMYRITARSGTVLNDGDLIQLEGQPRIERLLGKPTAITGQRLRWLPGKERIEVEGKPMAQQPGIEITAREARFRLDANKLELRGSPTLLHWQKPPARPGPPPDLVVRVIQADWYPASGILRAPGAVAGERRLGKGSKPQTITASGMEGNTEQRQLTLFAPVRFVDPSSDAVVDAQRTEVDLARETISSAAPFGARAGSSQAWGDAFVIDLKRSRGHVPRGCRLQQPAESLQAQQCSWNWQQRRFAASGDVELRRRDPQQITRSSSLTGKLGSGGQALFSTPEGRVQTTLKLPSKARGKPAQQSAIAL